MAQTTFKIEVAQAMPFDELKKLVGANPVFFDNTEPNNGLNQKASRYDQTATGGDWQVRIRVVALMSASKTDPVVTEYRCFSGVGRVLDHNELNQTGSPWSAVITILDENNNDIGGNLIVGQEMTFKAVFTLSSGVATDYPDAFARLRMQKSGGGASDLYEYSSRNDNKAGLPLFDATDYTVLQVGVPAANKFTATCKIDGNKIIAGQRYLFAANLSME